MSTSAIERRKKKYSINGHQHIPGHCSTFHFPLETTNKEEEIHVVANQRTYVDDKSKQMRTTTIQTTKKI